MLNKLDYLVTTWEVKLDPLSDMRTQGLPCHKDICWRRNEAVNLAMVEEYKAASKHLVRWSTDIMIYWCPQRKQGEF